MPVPQSIILLIVEQASCLFLCTGSGACSTIHNLLVVEQASWLFPCYSRNIIAGSKTYDFCCADRTPVTHRRTASGV